MSESVLRRDVVDGQPVWVSPGWVDLQVNGFAGADFNAAEPEPATVAQVSRALMQEGVTRYFPTVITASEVQMHACVAAIWQGCENDALSRTMVAGIHLEGPWLSAEEGARGAHPMDHLRAPSLVEFDRLQAAAQGMIRLVTLAPELEGAVPLIEYLVAKGVVVSLGHTLANEAQISAAVDAGATLSTHLGNGAPSVLPRHPNMIWTQMAEDRLFASAIFDGHHLPRSVMKSISRAKGAERMILVSDAAAPARCGPGIYQASIGGIVELNEAGRLSLLGTPYLAGAALGLVDGISHAVTMAGCSLEDACRMASVNPCRLMGLAVDHAETYFIWDEALGKIRVVGSSLLATPPTPA